jgi:hypothetical protein
LLKVGLVALGNNFFLHMRRLSPTQFASFTTSTWYMYTVFQLHYSLHYLLFQTTTREPSHCLLRNITTSWNYQFEKQNFPPVVSAGVIHWAVEFFRQSLSQVLLSVKYVPHAASFATSKRCLITKQWAWTDVVSKTFGPFAHLAITTF